MRKPKDARSERVALRMTPRLRYGLSLLAERKYRVTESEMICRAVEVLLKEEGLDDRGNSGLLHTPLDKLWSPNKSERVLSLCLNAPELATVDEQLIGQVLLAIKRSSTKEELKAELDKTCADFILDPVHTGELIELAEEMLVSNPKLSALFTPGSFREFLAPHLP